MTDLNNYNFKELNIKEPNEKNLNIENKNVYKIGSLFGSYQLDDLKSVFIPTNKHKIIYLHLDTDNMLYREDGKLSWGLTESSVYTAGNINIRQPIRNIVGMHLMPFRLAESTTTYSKDNIYRWSILIDELQSDSFMNVIKYHFVTTGTKVNSVTDAESTAYIEMTMANFNHGYYWFKEPIYSLSSITFSFGNLLSRFDVPAQISKWRVDQTSNPMHLVRVFTITPYLIQTESIIITGFTTGDTVTDSAVIASINDQVLTTTAYDANNIYIGAISLATTTSTGSDLFVYVKSYRYRTIMSLELITEGVEEM